MRRQRAPPPSAAPQKPETEKPLSPRERVALQGRVRVAVHRSGPGHTLTCYSAKCLLRRSSFGYEGRKLAT